MSILSPRAPRTIELIKSGHSKNEVFTILVKEFEQVDPKKIAREISEFPEPVDYLKNRKWILFYPYTLFFPAFAFLINSAINHYIAQHMFNFWIDVFCISSVALLMKAAKEIPYTIMLAVSFGNLCGSIAGFFSLYLSLKYSIGVILFTAITFILVPALITYLGYFLIKRTYKRFYLKRFAWDESKNEPTFL